MKFAFYVALMAQSVVASSTGEISAVRLEPLTDWPVQQSKYGCSLQRAFGSTEKPTLIESRRDEPMSGRFDIAITSEEFELGDESFKATLEPNGIEYRPPMPGKERGRDGSIWTYWDHDIREAITQDFSNQDYDGYRERNGLNAFLNQVETLEIDGLFERDISLVTGPIGGLRERLDDCYQKVMIDHGIPVEDAKEDSRPIEFSNRKKVLESLLPTLPEPYIVRLRQKKQINVGFVIFLDANAKPTGCRLTTTPRYSQLEKIGCDRLQKDGRFRFKKGEKARPAMVQAGFLYREDVGFAFTG